MKARRPGPGLSGDRLVADHDAFYSRRIRDELRAFCRNGIERSASKIGRASGVVRTTWPPDVRAASQ